MSELVVAPRIRAACTKASGLDVSAIPRVRSRATASSLHVASGHKRDRLIDGVAEQALSPR